MSGEDFHLPMMCASQAHEFRPGGLAFFWPLITLFARCMATDMFLADFRAKPVVLG